MKAIINGHNSLSALGAFLPAKREAYNKAANDTYVTIAFRR